MVTMEDIYRQVLKAPSSRERYWDQVALDLGLTQDDQDFDRLVKSMRVSGYLRVDDDELTIGPTPLPAASGGGVIPARRPRPGSKTEAPDRLRLAARARLWDDENLAGSDYVRDRDGGEVCVAGVTKDGQPTVRVGVQPEDRKTWEADEDDPGTVTLTADGVAALGRGVEEVIAAAEQAAVPYREAEKRLDLAGDRLKNAEGPRVGAQAAEDAFYAGLNRDSDIRRKTLWAERDDLQRFANALDESERAEYDDQEARYQVFAEQTGSEAHVYASGDERRDARARQMVIIHPHLTVAEATEFLRIQEVRLLSRSRAMNERETELLAKMGGQRTYDRGTWLHGMVSAYNKDREIDDYQALIERVEASAKPVTAEQRAEIDAAWAEIREAQAYYDALAGEDICTVNVPGVNGTLVMRATQGKEGDGHRYRVDVRPPDAREDWSPGDTAGDAWEPKPADLRRLAEISRKQLTNATPPGWRPPPSGVPQV